MQARPGTPRSLLSVLTGGGPVPDTDEGLAELIDRFNSLPPRGAAAAAPRGRYERVLRTLAAVHPDAAVATAARRAAMSRRPLGEGRGREGRPRNHRAVSRRRRRRH